MPNSDFNGDGRDDLLWQNDQYMVGYWYGEADGSFTVNPTLRFAPLDWVITGTGDFNGDGRDDILWRNHNGTVGYWYGEADGSFTVNSTLTSVPHIWAIAGTGDFNGDGRDDILWRHNDGRVGTWLGQADGSFVTGIEISVPLSWRITGTGDFDGDGRDDILWQGYDLIGTWSGAASGGFVVNSELSVARRDALFVADFNGDGRDDAVIPDDWSFYNVFYSMPGGGFDSGEYNPFGDSSSPTTLRTVGDYDGDGIDDTVFRHTDGRLLVNGELAAAVPNNWHIATDWSDWWWF